MKRAASGAVGTRAIADRAWVAFAAGVLVAGAIGTTGLVFLSPGAETGQAGEGGPASTPARRRADHAETQEVRTSLRRIPVPSLQPESKGRSDEAPTAVPDLDDAQVLANLREEYRNDLAAHESDWKDPSWAPQAEQDLHRQFSDVPGAHIVREVDCRTSTCVATVEWASFAEAVSGYQRLVTVATEPNCASKMLLNDQTGNGPYSEKLILDCTESRANATR